MDDHKRLPNSAMRYTTAGEVFDRHLAQDRDALAGKILRLTPDGEVPEGNPFAGEPVYTYGHRNPQGLAWDPQTGLLFASEHGPSGEVGFGVYDEVNIFRAGANYGWPEVTTSPSGITCHQGDLFIATLGSRALLRIVLNRQTGTGYMVEAIERWFRGEDGDSRYGRLRDAVVGPDGALYVLTNNRDGRGRPRPENDRILRLTGPGP